MAHRVGGGPLTWPRPVVLCALHGRQDLGETALLLVLAAPEKVLGGGPEFPQVLAQPLRRQRPQLASPAGPGHRGWPQTRL